MITEYVVLGGVLVVAGAVQMWLRYGPWAKEQKEAESALARRIAERSAAAERQGTVEEGAETEGGEEARSVMMARGSRVWNKWTGILGPLSIAFGLMLVIWGLVDS